MLLYLTSNQKSNLIDPAVRNMTLPAKKLVGRFSLKSFVTKDMRNYANAKFFVVDAACIEESGNDFTLALQSFQMMFSARIIVILSGYEDVNGEVQRLLSIGVVNLVTGETMEDALDELTEALSEDGMQRYVVKAPVYEQPATQREKAPEPDEIIPYRWNARNIRIAVAGSQRRSGVTVTAFNLASWLAARGAEVAYIEVNQNRHLQLLLNIYEAAPDGEHYTIDGIDCYLTNEPDKAYQFIIYDCGVMQTPTSIFRDADHRLLCGSVLPYRHQAELRGTPEHKAKNWMGSMLFHLSHANDVDQAWASSRTREELDQVVEPFVQAKRQTGQWTQEDEAGYQLYRQETDPKKRTFRVWYLIANPRGLPKEFVQKELEFRWKLFPEKKEETK